MRRALLSLLLFVAIVAAAGFGAARAVQEYIDAPAILAPDDSLFLIRRGESWRSVTERLGEAGWVEQPQWLYWFGRLTKKSGSIKAGEYRLSADLSPEAVLALFASGKSVQYSVTLIEGWTAAYALEQLRANADLEDQLHSLSDAELAAELGVEHLEGWLLPETYFYERGASDLDIVKRAHAAMRDTLERVWAQRQDDLPLDNSYEALILASIIEKETGLASERPVIGGVFVRRLRKGMMLQTDPTVIYGMGERFDGNIRRSDLRRDTPYNTYTRHGLTPTPIALPGEAALIAATQPDDTGALYFVAKADGSGAHQFSNTLKEHNRAVRRYQLR